ncbi:Two pore potassium channel c [Linum grandiflorum]
MDKEPLLPFASPRFRPPPPPPPLCFCPLPENDEFSLPTTVPMTPSELKDHLIFGPFTPSPHESASASSMVVEALTLSQSSPRTPTPISAASEYDYFPKSNLHRSRTAPAMAGINEIAHHHHDHDPAAEPNPQFGQKSVVSQAFVLLRVGGRETAGRYIIDVKKGRMRIRMKVGLALGVVFLCIGVGVGVMHFIERLGWVDSLYLSVMSVTTVGYGDRAFESMHGRIFASIWLLVSTLAVARAFLYLAEARVDKRQRRMAKWVLGHDMTVSEFLAADIDHNGYVSKSEYVIYKLKEMGKVSEKDVRQICDNFDRIDSGNLGKITLNDLIAGQP